MRTFNSFSAKLTQILIISTLLFLSCKEKKTIEREYSPEVARLVSQVTGGMIGSSDPIRVVFTQNMTDESRIGQALKEDVFEFEPSIDGVSKWQDGRTLVFQPNEALPFRKAYQGQLLFDELFPETEYASLKPLYFSFQVSGREIREVHADFELARENDPQRVTFDGIIFLTEISEASAVKKACQIELDGKSIGFSLTGLPDQKGFKFSSEEIIRGQAEQELVMKIIKSGLDLSQDHEQKFLLPAVSDFKVVSVSAVTEGQEPYILIGFSDQLKSGQELRGFISVQPGLDLQVQDIQKKIMARGNFELGQDYTVTVQPGIKSRWATATRELFSETIRIEDMRPDIRFANEGVFLPSSNQKKILFQTVNVKRAKLKIMKVFESNLGQFLQNEQLSGARERREEFNWNIDQVGLTVVDTFLQIGATRNQWLQHELDLQKLIKDDDKGCFLLGLSFEREDMLYDLSTRYRGREYDYYNDPSSYGYLYYHGRVYKPIIRSDLGITYKKGKAGHYVFVTDLISAAPLAGVRVRLKTYQHQLIAEGMTNGEGMVDFPASEQQVFYLEAEKGNQRSALKLNEMSWNLTTFDVGGSEAGDRGVRAFIYTERGVYRPGDPINLCAIIRNDEDTFPDGHPVSMTISNPKNQVVFEQTKKDGVDGFYHFMFKGNEDDLTGKYQAKIKAGSETFTHELRIETVMAERLKVEIDAIKQQFSAQDRMFKATLISKYLFGNPAGNLDAEVTINLESVEKSFKKYEDFSFSNQTLSYDPVSETLFEGKLDAGGEASILWTFPSFVNAPSALRGQIIAKVLESGGRASKGFLNISIDPYSYYVGVKPPDLDYHYAATGQALNISAVAVDPEGAAQAGRTLNYRIYRNERRWWWEYDSRDQYRLRFKSDRSTRLVKDGRLVSGSTPATISFTFEERGEYLIEVQDGVDGHIASFFLSAYPWGESPTEGKEAGILALKTDKEKYRPGDKAVVSFPVPEQATILLTVEKGGKILWSKWQQQAESVERRAWSGEREAKGEGRDVTRTARSSQMEKKIEIEVTEEMLPTAYVSVSLIQPHEQTANDRPLRMYGVVPINGEDAATRQELKINMPAELQPKQDFEVEIQTADRKATQLTIAVVDEGLLSLTHFDTPDPWKEFYRKQRLAIETFDLFNHVIGVNKGDILQTFSIGGDMELDYRARQLQEEKAKRFEPVCLFSGGLTTDSNGKAKARFHMPNYIGAVRVMAVAAKGNRYGSAEKSVPVKSDLMVMPTLPRVLAPDDKISVPVTVFAMREQVGAVTVSIEVSDPLEISGENSKQLSFAAEENAEIFFSLRAKAAVGVGKIKIKAVSSKFEADSETEIAIRASSPYIRTAETKEIKPGGSGNLRIPDQGLPGTNQATISVQRRPNLKLSNRLLGLIHYPYGCIEQLTSAVFPQLYLKTFIPKSSLAFRDIDENINAGIARLRKFQMPTGGFTYWPGRSELSVWGTIYGGHFLVEAKKLGYNVPSSLYNNWLKFLQARVRSNEGEVQDRVYAVYVLAAAGAPHLGAMNLLKENYLAKMNDSQRCFLAGAYRLAGVDEAADEILRSTGMKVTDYYEFGGSYGSGLRDKAIILEQMTLAGYWQQAHQIADELALALSSEQWYSTQTTGYMLLALGKYLRVLEGDKTEEEKLVGKITMPDGKTREFDTKDMSFQIDISSDFGKEATVALSEKSTVKRAFVVLEWSGKPMQYLGQDESRNLNLEVRWLDENGAAIDPTRLRQGTIFWGHFRVSKTVEYNYKIEEIALVQLLPSGWEIDNVRLSGETQPEWMKGWRLNREEYLDLRDDRALWFFDMNPHEQSLDFIIKLSAVTVGEFFLPPTQVEAMYNNTYKAMKAGRKVDVVGR